MAVPKPCLAAGCPEDALPGRSRCRRHETERNRAHMADPVRTGKRGTTPGWMRARRRALRRDHGLCVECGAPAETVHHVDGDSTNDALENCLSCCWPCHRRLDAALREARRQAAPARR